MNRELLHRVADQIERQPDRYRQDAFLVRTGLEGFRPEGPCGSAACVAGWALALKKGSATGSDTLYDARCLLALSKSAADRLFRAKWPERWYWRAGIPVDEPGARTPAWYEAAAIIRAMADEGAVWA